MSKSTIAAALCAATLLSAPAIAQAAKPHFITRQATNEWRASKLVGVDVYGSNNKKIGSIQEILLNRQGQAKVAVIGLGGFLGIGQKNVGVPYSSLTWTNRAEGRTAATPNNVAGANSAATAASRGYPERAMVDATTADLKNAPSFKFASASNEPNNSGAAGSSTSGAAATSPAPGAVPAPAPAPAPASSH